MSMWEEGGDVGVTQEKGSVVEQTTEGNGERVAVAQGGDNEGANNDMQEVQ